MVRTLIMETEVASMSGTKEIRKVKQLLPPSNPTNNQPERSSVDLIITTKCWLSLGAAMAPTWL